MDQTGDNLADVPSTSSNHPRNEIEGGGGGGGGGGDDDGDDGDDGDDNPDDDHDDDGDDNNVDAHIFDTMTFRLTMESEDSIVQKWLGHLTPPEVDYADYVPIFYRRISGAFFRFYLYLLNLVPTGLSCWWETEVAFESERAEGEIEKIHLPMRLKRVHLYDANHDSLRDLVSGQMNDLVSRVQDLIHSGSDWTFQKVCHCEAHVSRNLQNIFNNIGWSRTQLRQRRRFGTQSSCHLNSKSTYVLSRHLISLCSDVGDCFILCLGIGLDGLTKERLTALNANDTLCEELKSRLRTLVAQNYDINSCQTYPVSLHQIEAFRIANKDKICLNIYGFYLDHKAKSRSRYIFFPVSIDKNMREGVSSVDLVITHRSEGGEYHLNYCIDFHKMLRNSVSYKSSKHLFCHFCCSGHDSLKDLKDHESYCAEGEPCIIFPPPTERLEYEAKKKSSPSVAIFVGDIETKLSESDVSFGRLSKTRGVMDGMMIGYCSKFLIHEDIFPNTCPILLEGPGCVDRHWKFIRFDVFYVNSLISQKDMPMTPLSAEEEKLIRGASHCANCRKFLAVPPLAHHCHIDGRVLSAVCPRCNQILRKLEILNKFYHNLQFDASFLVHSLNSKDAKQHISKVQVFAKEAQKIMKLDITFRCYICHPDELLTEADLDELVVFPHREDAMRAELLNEYRHKLDVVRREIEFQRESLLDTSVIEMTEEGDESEDQMDESLLDRETEGLHGNDGGYCRHYAAYYHRRLCIKDSLMLIRASLDKSLKEMYSTALQPNRCEAFPDGFGPYPDVDLWLGESKQCACCVSKHSLKKDLSDVCHFAVHGLGDLKYAPKLLKKLNFFPYSMLHMGTARLKAEASWPSKDSFKNSLRDNEEISDADYVSLKTDCFEMGVETGYSLLVLYLHCDLLGLINLLNVSTIYLYQNFGLNLLRHMSISKFGFELILKCASETVGSQGLEFVSSEKLYRHYKKGNFGGFLSCNKMGQIITPNHIYNQDFDVSSDQSVYVNLDIASHYGSVLLTSFPYTDHQFYDQDSDLVQDMNRALDSGTLFKYIANLRESKDLHIFMDVVLSFPREVQIFLQEFVPIVGKRVISLNDLSYAQRKYASELQIPVLESAINVSDFSQQNCLLTAEYVQTLVNLGVQVLRITEVSTSLRHPIFLPIIQKILRLKNETQLSFRRNWMKLLNNSCFGFLLLKVESHTKSKLAVGSAEIRKIFERSDLDHFTLISPTQLLAYLRPAQVHYRYAKKICTLKKCFLYIE